MNQDLKHNHPLTLFGRSLWFSLVGASVMLCSGCGTEADPRGQRVAVSGHVTLDNELLSRARIIFVTDAGNGAVKATAIVEDGLFAIDARHGPLPGPASVEVHPETVDLEEFEAGRGGDRYKHVEPRTLLIPPKYNTRTELTAEVTAAGSNQFKFDLKTK